MTADPSITWSWVRPYTGRAELHAVAVQELRPFRDSANGQQQRPWSLNVTETELVADAAEPGPAGWLPCLSTRQTPMLDRPSPADPLLHSIAADLFVLIAAQPVQEWAGCLDALGRWSHRRRWRGRGSGARGTRVHTMMATSVAGAELARGLDSAWTVVQIVVDAMSFTGIDADAAWDAIAERLAGQLSVPRTVGAPSSLTRG